MENYCDVILVTFFGGVIVMTSLKWRHNWYFRFDFVIISLKKQNLAISRNFRLPISKVKWRWGRKALERLAIFEFFFTKIMHFRRISAKFQPEIQKRVHY